MKNFIRVIVIGLLVVLGACGGDREPAKDTVEPPTAVKEVPAETIKEPAPAAAPTL